MEVKIPHNSSKHEAVAKVQRLLLEAKPQLEQKIKIEEERWDGDTLHFSFSAEGKQISGTLAVEDAQYHLNAKLPLLMRMFESRIESMIMEQSKQMLG